MVQDISGWGQASAGSKKFADSRYMSRIDTRSWTAVSAGSGVEQTLLDISWRYCDFFVFLYQTIQQKLQGELANRWEDANIEFIFSVPTTWKPVPTVERFRSIIERAGFGRHPNHRADIGLTEAEAAAVHTARVFPRLFNVWIPLSKFISVHKLTIWLGERRASGLWCWRWNDGS